MQGIAKQDAVSADQILWTILAKKAAADLRGYSRSGIASPMYLQALRGFATNLRRII
jgi:hypothetical protein